MTLLRLVKATLMNKPDLMVRQHIYLKECEIVGTAEPAMEEEARSTTAAEGRR